MVSLPKQQKIIATTHHFLAHHQLPNTVIRFDVACLIADTLTYIPNAFTPMERYGY
jgi:Holliday junction resolvase-like predicted endonuclease